MSLCRFVNEGCYVAAALPLFLTPRYSFGTLALARAKRHSLMQHNLGPEGLAVVAVYILILLAIGWFSRTKVNNLADFVVAGRSMNRWQIGLSIVATWVSGTTILAFPAMGYTNGLAIYFFGSGASLTSGLWAGFYVIPYMRKHELLTVPEVLETWFGPRHRIVALLAVWPASWPTWDRRSSPSALASPT